MTKLLLIASTLFLAQSPLFGTDSEGISNESNWQLGQIRYSSDNRPYEIYYDLSSGLLMPKLNQDSDPSTPKPQPTTYAIRYWPAFRISNKLTKGVPRHLMVFFDKDGTVIKSYSYKKKNNTTPADELEKYQSLVDLSKILSQPYGSSYDCFRFSFMHGLFLSQRKLSEKDTYLNFIDPFITEAETKLKIAKFGINNFGNKLCKEYYECITNYITGSCQYESQKSFMSFTTHLPRVEEGRKKLKKVLLNIKKEALIEGLDVDDEFSKTNALVKKIAVDYCSQENRSSTAGEAKQKKSPSKIGALKTVNVIGSKKLGWRK